MPGRDGPKRSRLGLRILRRCRARVRGPEIAQAVLAADQAARHRTAVRQVVGGVGVVGVERAGGGRVVVEPWSRFACV